MSSMFAGLVSMGSVAADLAEDDQFTEVTQSGSVKRRHRPNVNWPVPILDESRATRMCEGRANRRGVHLCR